MMTLNAPTFTVTLPIIVISIEINKHLAGWWLNRKKGNTMKKIGNNDAMRILAHLQKARAIIEKAQAASDDGEISMDTNIAEECLGHLDEILISINNTILE